MRRLPISEVNTMPGEAFVAAFGGIAEHSDWVATIAERRRPYADRDDMVAAFEQAVRVADRETQLDLLNAHPDLAGRAAIAGDIGADSRSEQAGAGLDSLTAAEFDRFTDLNARYRERFGFPFILAVRGATKHDILAAFERRIDNDPDAEFATAIEQVCRIMRFRLEDRVGE
ncbi:2-oxo-4-hydroxy-4-carboxy-5-ureidoimidazoline decarboxylase [Tepidamorphus gemmatus]|uniref:2-oxo-4-hydroxy-4-carboxy-5-ureidoimidazoline decarboxylase n=1 Tax=Tepidamorphus gemmatus TaxID=747076 RepID=A0A4R3MH12_9HYPH|nr:2-oxo-4-hydroxy-4-carboxy-5-ureidoimidazoline decarboxylase [Tepidamorphus gemmatus]TCT12507.1 2-oxo-4-hydroxy-4-carboxy-5-ureidoimidazoline decarboxylase [Tepidamorphus gemmatus]